MPASRSFAKPVNASTIARGVGRDESKRSPACTTRSGARSIAMSIARVPDVVDVALALVEVALGIELAAELLVPEVRVGEVDDPHRMYAGSSASVSRRTFIAGDETLEARGERVHVELEIGRFATHQLLGHQQSGCEHVGLPLETSPAPTPTSASLQNVGSSRPARYWQIQ